MDGGGVEDPLPWYFDLISQEFPHLLEVSQLVRDEI